MSMLLISAAAIAAVFVFSMLIAIMLRRVVPTNMVHIIQRGKSTVAYGKGKDAGNVYYAWPSWVPRLGVSVIQFPESIFQVQLEDYDAYDQARLPFVVDVTAFFRVDDANSVAQRVESFSELISQLQSVLQGSVRRVLATNDLEEIMQSRSELGDQFTSEVRDQISEWGVKPVKTIEFMDLRDAKGSAVIANIMDKEKSRIEMESRVKVAENDKLAKLAEIDAMREADVRAQDALQQVGQRTAEKEKAVGIANEQARQEILSSAKTTAERDMEVRKVNDVRSAEIQSQVAVVQANQNKQVAIVNAQAAKETQVVQAEAEKASMVVKAEGDKLSTVTKAEGDLQAAIKEADGIRATGEAKAAAEQAMLMAPVTTQIELAREIGGNEGYQTYLITIEKVRASQTVGIEMAKAMQGAELKVIANAGDIQGGVAKLGDLFSPAGGTNLTGMLAALGQTEEGRALIEGVTSRLAGSAK